MINYSVKNGIYPIIEVITPEEIIEANNKVEKGEVQFRYVIDMKSLNNILIRFKISLFIKN